MAWITQPLASYLFRRLLLRRQVSQELEAPRTRTMAKSARGQCHLFGPTAGDLAFASIDCPRRTTENHGPKEADETPHGGHDPPYREVNRPLEATSSDRHWRPREGTLGGGPKRTVSPHNVHETGVSLDGQSASPIVAAEAEQVEQLEENDLVTGPDPRFLCPSSC
jgi:hypothetical protein